MWRKLHHSHSEQLNYSSFSSVIIKVKGRGTMFQQELEEKKICQHRSLEGVKIPVKNEREINIFLYEGKRGECIAKIIVPKEGHYLRKVTIKTGSLGYKEG